MRAVLGTGSRALVGVAFLAASACLPGAAEAASGALSALGCVAEGGSDHCVTGHGLHGIHGIVVSPDGANVYAAGKWATDSGAQGQVAEFRRDGKKGRITEIGCVAERGADGCSSGPGLAGAAGIAISPDGSNVYVASDQSDAVVAFRRNATTGALTETGCIAEAGVEGCSTGTGLAAATGVAVSRDGASVYTTSERSDAIAEFHRNRATGALAEIGCIAEAAADGCAPGAGLTHAENLVLSPDGSWVYTTALTANAVAEFHRDRSTGVLAESACIAESGADGCITGHGLSGADGIAISADGSSVYTASEAASALATFARSSGGALTERSCVAEHGGDGCRRSRGLSGVARIAVSPAGDNVYAAGYFGNTLVTFARARNGSLTGKGCLGARGNGDSCPAVGGLRRPAGVAVSPDGRNVYTGSQRSNALAAFVRDPPRSRRSHRTSKPSHRRRATPPHRS
jgi:DNA-binding beta-propeller fold protein YncE